jgi:hypothetical protein
MIQKNISFGFFFIDVSQDKEGFVSQLDVTSFRKRCRPCLYNFHLLSPSLPPKAGQ